MVLAGQALGPLVGHGPVLAGGPAGHGLQVAVGPLDHDLAGLSLTVGEQLHGEADFQADVGHRPVRI